MERLGRWSEEKYLLGQTKHRSNVYPIVQGDLLENSTDRDMHYKCTRGMEAQKYLRKDCCHHIKCSIANFLVTLMWRRPLNSTVLATSTYKGLERVFDGISTQVVIQMINKCRAKIIQKKLYNVRNPPQREGEKSREKYCSHLELTL